MASPAYNQIADAMRRRQPMTCIYDGCERTFCPIVLGHSEGQEKALMFQVGGRTSEGPLSTPKWKCFFVSKIRTLEFCGGEWRAGELHRRSKRASTRWTSTSIPQVHMSQNANLTSDAYSHSIVPGGLLVRSYTTRLTPCSKPRSHKLMNWNFDAALLQPRAFFIVSQILMP